VRVDEVGRTSVAGVWAAGNVANPRAQVITAAGEGSAAAISINADLVDQDLRNALERRRRGAAVNDRKAAAPGTWGSDQGESRCTGSAPEATVPVNKDATNA
jgi:hypothetical protein